MDHFLFSTAVVLHRLMRDSIDKRGLAKCNAVLSLTSNIIKVPMTVDFQKISTNVKNNKNYKSYVELVNESVKIICFELTSMTDLKWPFYEIVVTDSRGIGWQTVDAPWTWEWIHIVTFHLDLEFGLKEKVSFCNFIQYTIGCKYCEHHYIAQLKFIINSLEEGSISNIFFILHTSIAKDQGYTYAPDRIDITQKKKFLKNYLKARQFNSTAKNI